MIWRLLLGLLMTLHGAVHVLGFVVPWQLAEPEGFQYKTTLLSGRLDVGPFWIRVVGVIWLVLALAFVAGAIGLWTRQSWWWGWPWPPRAGPSSCDHPELARGPGGPRTERGAAGHPAVRLAGAGVGHIKVTNSRVLRG